MNKLNTLFIFVILILLIGFFFENNSEVNYIRKNLTRIENELSVIDYKIQSTEMKTQKKTSINKNKINEWLENNEETHIDAIIPYYLNGKEFEGYVIFYKEKESSDSLNSWRIYSERKNIFFKISLFIALFNLLCTIAYGIYKIRKV